MESDGGSAKTSRRVPKYKKYCSNHACNPVKGGCRGTGGIHRRLLEMKGVKLVGKAKLCGLAKFSLVGSVINSAIKLFIAESKFINQNPSDPK
jgi:hypothetical protein